MFNIPGNTKDCSKEVREMQNILVEVMPHFISLDWKLWEDHTPDEVEDCGSVVNNLDKKYLCIMEKCLGMGSGVYTFKEMCFWDGIGFIRYETIGTSLEEAVYADDVKYFARFC